MKTSRLLWLAIPLLNALSQIFIKLAAQQVSGAGWTWLQQTVTSPWMIAAIVVEGLCFVIWMQVLTELELSKAFPLTAFSYILILAASWTFFGEPISPLQLIGSALILAGVWLISAAGNISSDTGRKRPAAAKLGPSASSRLSERPR